MHARTAPPVLLLLLLAVAALCCTLPLAAAKDYDRSCAISFSQDESDPSYGTYCRLFSISGSSGFFDCRCSGANTTQPVLRDVSFIDGSFQPGFMWFALALPSNVSAQYNYTLPDGQLRSASASVGANASRFDRVKRAPASITYQMRYEGELGPGESVDFVAGWLPCRSDNPVQAQAPQAPAKGSNAVTFSWSLPCLADGPLDQLTYDLYLQNDTSTHFDRIRTGIRGSDTSISSVPIERRCEAYTARLQGVSRLLNGSTGPECLEAYDDLKFYVRNGPADPGPPTVDESTIETKALEVVWKASADDGGCPLTYIVSLLDSQRTNITYVTVQGLKNNSAVIPHGSLKAGEDYQVVLEAVTAAGSSKKSTYFRTKEAAERNPAGAIAGGVSGVIIVAGVLAFFVWRRRRIASHGSYQTI